MVSLRRRKLLGLCSGKSSFIAPFPKLSEIGTAPDNPIHHTRLVSVHAISSDPISSDIYQTERSSVLNLGPSSSNVSGSSSSKDQNNQSDAGPPIKRRKRHRRKHFQNQEPCLMRGVYFKNMKWQAAIKVDKKQIHLGTVSSQEEAARLYDRAAFMCGREPNFELSEEEKQELRKFNWDEFLAITRNAITNKKHKRRLGTELQNRYESPLMRQQNDDWDDKQGVVNTLSASQDKNQDTSLS